MIRSTVLFLFAFWIVFSQSAWAERCDCERACSFQSVSSAPLCTFDEAQSCGGNFETRLTSQDPATLDPRVRQFQNALSSQRENLLRLYENKITDAQYSKLAILAMGILGNESRFYQSPRYFLKSWIPGSAVKIVRCVVRSCTQAPVSDGPTQMKRIPKPIAEHYGATPATLYNTPAHAAVATMGFLIEMRSELLEMKKRYPAQLAEMNDSNMVEYLSYFYQGKGRRILQGEKPSPEKNIYLAQLNKHFKSMSIQQLTCGSSPPQIATGNRR